MRKSYYSDACIHNQHPLCRDQDCQCGCHTLKIDAEELEALKRKARKEEAEALDNFLGKFTAAEVVKQ